MLVPISWLKDFIDITIPPELLAEKLTLAGLEVAKIHYVGVAQTAVEGIRLPPSDHLVWNRDKLVLGAIHEVRPHPNADRLIIAMVDHGASELEATVTGAPNLFAYRGLGVLPSPLWTAFAREGAEVWDGHSAIRQRMILKEKPLRGIPNRCMVCSAYELGIDDDADGIILLHENPGFPPGTPLQDVFGDVILEIEFTPNLARAISIYGVAREAAAILDVPLKPPSFALTASGAPIAGAVQIDIREPEYNPRFTLALLRGCTIAPSPEWMQRRLRAVGQRPINNIVDVTNYVNFEIGQPLHAFDYDKLAARAGGSTPTIITRFPEPGERLRTLDEVDRALDAHNILVTDTVGALSIGGIIGGADTEIDAGTTNVMLEAASWNNINIRRSMSSQKVFTDASYRFSRGVHPSQAILGVQRGISLMHQTGGGEIASGILDSYPRPAPVVTVDLHTDEIARILGVTIPAGEAAAMLKRAGFTVRQSGNTLKVTAPDTRMDIDTDPVTGQADLIEEIGRIYGYDRLPTTMIADAMPPQHPNPALEIEETTRDLLVGLGFRENIAYRLTTPAREAALVPPGAESPLIGQAHVMLANFMTEDKTVMRRTLLAHLLETAAANARHSARQAVFEIGAVYLPVAGAALPDEPRRLALLLTGTRDQAHWSGGHAVAATDARAVFDFYDLKGAVEGLIAGLHIGSAHYTRAQHSSFHPGRSAALVIGERTIGVFGELHPLIAERFGMSEAPVLMAEFDLDLLISANKLRDFPVRALPQTPPVLQDMALIVPDTVTTEQVEAVIRQTGGAIVKAVRLFDVYTGEPIAAGSKSLAFALTYQTDERTLSDKDVAPIHAAIARACATQLGATLRG
ncbi:MAG: phenylalanine--tRNA ligase subunit beta [Chloroflexota bacterium]|nr:phenylalanine--tRNA ligase subunit beta [Chloroflexota bacterium]